MEANKAGYLSQLASYVPPRLGEPMQAATTCHARAVASYEWKIMPDGRTAPRFSPSTRQINQTLHRMDRR